jgi:MerR family transcriptional regulator, light-induced transcriptional regulator
MGRYRMKAVSRLTGVRPELLRMWEKRYPLFKPPRAGNRYREFDDEDVQLLVYIRQQIEQGRSIGELAAEGRDRLLRQIAPATAPTPPGHTAYTDLIGELLGYIQHLKKAQLEARLLECMAHYSFAILLHQVFVPLMHRLGELWAAHQLSLASEHLATMLLKQRLLTMLHATTPGAYMPLMLCACPAGERHELGLLTFAYTLQQEGWQVCYLGPDLPVADMLYACQHLQPALVALSLTHTAGLSQCLEVVGEIDEVLASSYLTFVGGQSVAAYHHAVRPHHVLCFSTLLAAQRQARQLHTRFGVLDNGEPQLGKVAVSQ